jgi:hypothetical protein
MRWGMPPQPRTGGPPVTNIRNTSSPHWRGRLTPENRCLVPAFFYLWLAGLRLRAWHHFCGGRGARESGFGPERHKLGREPQSELLLFFTHSHEGAMT